jgi:predicted branched-subunit amino acid permease
VIPSERAAFIDGARLIGGTVFGTFCWGAAIGMALVKGGLSSMQALGMVMLVFSGTAQVAALPLIAQGAALPAIWLTALLANLRFVVYSAVVANEFRGRPMAQRLLIGWMTTDTGLAAYLSGQQKATASISERDRAARFMGANGLVYFGWTLGTAVGVGVAGLIPDSPRLAFVGLLAVVAIIGPMMSTRLAWSIAVPAAVVASLAATGPGAAGCSPRLRLGWRWPC